MNKLREDAVHYAVRDFLQKSQWQLIAGQYPNGSDDLPALNVLDPNLARDSSPDPRRHSSNKFVPDLVAYKNRIMLIIEMKPNYSLKDEEKLKMLLTERFQDLLLALKNLIISRKIELAEPLQDIVFVPCLGFSATSTHQVNPDFCYLKVNPVDTADVTFQINSFVSSLLEPVATNHSCIKGYIHNKVMQLDWNCVDTDTQYLTHSIHRYSGKFIPQIAKQAIELLTNPGEIVLDPYCGSGTTLLEAALNDRYAIGIDLNPLAVLISQVKTTLIEKNILQRFIQSFRDWAQPFINCDSKIITSNNSLEQLNLFDSLSPREEFIQQVHRDARWQNEWYRKWFSEKVLIELILLYNRIMLEPNQDCKNLGLVAFSDILRKCSNAHSSYPNVMFDKNKIVSQKVIPLFIDKLESISLAVSETEISLYGKPHPKVLRGNARSLPLSNCSIDSVITHPPYIGSIPYAEYGLLSITWLGYSAKELDSELTGGRRQSKNVVEQFKTGYSNMISEAYRVLKPGKMLFMLTGDPVIRGRRIDLAQMTIELAQQTNFTLVISHHRNGINRRANLMGQESLLIFLKE